MSGKTAGQQAYEAYWRYAADEFGADVDDAAPSIERWDTVPKWQQRALEAAGAAVETVQLRLAREDRDSLRKAVLDLAAKWDATADRNQRNGQSLIDQGDEYGNEGLAIAEALGACVIELRHAAEPPS